MDLSDLFPPRIVILSVSEGSSIYPILKILRAKAIRMTERGVRFLVPPASKPSPSPRRRGSRAGCTKFSRCSHGEGMTKMGLFQKNVDLVHILSFVLNTLPKMWTNIKWTYISLPSDGAAATVERAKPSKITNELSDSRLGKILVSISFIGRGGRRDYLDHSMKTRRYSHDFARIADYIKTS